METISFALGIASVMIVLMGTVIIWATLRVIKLKKTTEELKSLIDHVDRHMYTLHDKSKDDTNNGFRDVYNIIDRHYEELNRGIQQSVKHLEDYIITKINDTTNENKKYVDSRIDKLIDAYFLQKEATMKTKEIIKG